MATSNQVNLGLSGSSGTGSFAGTTSATLVTPLLGTPTSGTLTNCTGLPIAGTTGYGTGVATALGQNVTGSGSIVLANAPTFVTGTVTAPSVSFSSTSGIIGTTTNDNAAALSVGQFVTSNVAINTTSLTTGTIADTTSISLTAGDWDVFGAVGFFGGATTTPTFLKGWISTSSASDPGAPNYANLFTTGVPFATSPIVFTVPSLRVSIASTTIVYLTTQALFTTSTCTSGGVISARRRR